MVCHGHAGGLRSNVIGAPARDLSGASKPMLPSCGWRCGRAAHAVGRLREPARPETAGPPACPGPRDRRPRGTARRTRHSQRIVLPRLPGIGVLLAAKLLGETGDVRRFRSEAAFAAVTGTAPIPASSGQTQRHRLNRGGNRQLNRALHFMAIVQARTHLPPGLRGPQASRGQDLARGAPLPEAPPRRRGLPDHAARSPRRRNQGLTR